MPYQLICDACGHIIYAGYNNMQPVIKIVEPGVVRCRNCGAKLSATDFEIQIERA